MCSVFFKNMLSLFSPLSVKILFLRVLMRLNRIQNEIQITSSLKSFYLHPSGFTLCMFTTSFCDKKSLSPFILLGERQAVMYKLSLTSFQDILFSCRNLRNFFKVCFLKTMFFFRKESSIYLPLNMPLFSNIRLECLHVLISGKFKDREIQWKICILKRNTENFSLVL